MMTASASAMIDQQIAELTDWRGAVFARLRKLINEADAGLVEDWKWGTAVWNRKGNVCALGAFKDHLKINFFQGAALEDRHQLFNAGLEAKTTRSIDINQGDTIDEAALRQLIRAAAEHRAKAK